MKKKANKLLTTKVKRRRSSDNYDINEQLDYDIEYLKAIRGKLDIMTTLIIVSDGNEFYAIHTGDHEVMAKALCNMAAVNPSMNKVVNFAYANKKNIKNAIKEGLIPLQDVFSNDEALLELKREQEELVKMKESQNEPIEDWGKEQAS